MRRTPEFDVDKAHALFVSAAADASSEALAEALRIVAPVLLRQAGALTRSADDAADLVQDTLLVAIESRHRFEASRPLVPWLFGILLNLHRYRRRSAMRVVDASVVAPRAEDDPVVVVDRKLILEKIHSAIDALPKTYREVVALHVRNGLKPDEIAEVLRRTSGRVRTQLWRGLGLLREMLPRGFAPLVAAVIAVSAARASMDAAGGGGLAIASTITTGPAETSRGARSVGRIRRWPVSLGSLLVALGLVQWFLMQASAQGAGATGGTAPMPMPQTVAVADTTAHEPHSATRRSLEPGQPELRGRVRARLTWADSGLPVARQSVRLHVGPRSWMPLLPNWFDNVRESWTDDSGNLAFDEVPAGPASLLFDDGLAHSSEFFVPAGGVIDRIEVLTSACEIVGRVVDSDGHPIAGAAIWMSNTGANAAPGYVAGSSSIDGTFALRAPHRRWTIWATAEGLARSAVRSESKLLQRAGPLLVLGPSPAALRGTVRMQGGQPAAGALVGVFARQGARFPAGARAAAPAFRRADALGNFEVAGLEPGSHVVVARGAATCASLVDVDLEAGSTGNVELRLTNGATISGRAIRGAVPLGAFVSAGPTERRDTAPMINAAALVSADGTYRVENVLPGRVALQVFVDGEPSAAAEVPHVEEGAVAEVDLLPSPDRAAPPPLLGRVMDERGAPIDGIEVLGMPAAFGFNDMRDDFARCVTANGGLFRLSVRSGVEYRCLVLDQQGFARDMSAPAMAGAGEVLLWLAPSSRCASIRGVMGVPPEGPTDVELFQTPLGQFQRYPVGADGRFEIDQLPPGDYCLTYPKEAGRGRPRLATFHLDAGEARDLGWVGSPSFHDVRVQFRRADGMPIRSAGPASITADPGDVFVALTAVPQDGEVRTRLALGDYEVAMMGVDFLPLRQRFSVAAGQPCEVALDLLPARMCSFTFSLPATAMRTRMWLRIDGPDGNRIVERMLMVPEESFFRFDIGLPAGANTIRAVTAQGLAATAVVVLPDGGVAIEAPLSHEFPLR